MSDNHNTLAELFARDPLSLSDADLDRIIAEYQEKRRLFAATGKGQATVKNQVNLEELGLI